ncbi:MAG: serine hydrolase domain-containing protein [Ekhidna sp.]|uniref:serine hydrolase domain-containing protein n=1 Tax=Ekhidna sp. TaxID=2608089 RepID=UPI0032F0951A
MKKVSCLVGLMGLGWLLYYLFQPIVDWNFGWEPIPASVTNQRFEGVESPVFTDLIASSKQHLDSIRAATSSPSISIATMVQGRMVWSYAIGFQDIGNQIPADTSTQYRIGSVSKALTSLGLGRMIEKGLIHPDTSVQYYTNAFRDKPAITISQLASHQSGIRNYETCFCFPIWEYYRDKEFESIEASLADFEQDKLLFKPGSAFAYSSYNFTALSLAVEKASGVEFIDYMSRKVFAPLGMNLSEPDRKDEFAARRAIPYDTDRGMYKEVFSVNLSNKWAGGGFISTPLDLARAGNALLDSTFLSPETAEILTTPQRLDNDSINEQYYALGWRHSISERYFKGEKKVEVFHHGGMAVGGLALLIVYPEYDLVMAITMNKSGQQGQFELFDYITPIAESFIRRIEEKRSGSTFAK